MHRILEAMAFAKGAHLGQKYADKAYWHHLRDVADALIKMDRDTEFMLVVAWLHDVIEDTPATYQDIKEHFGEPVAEVVLAVTDELGRNRKERKEKTYPKIFATLESTLIKLADLGANVTHALRTESKLLQMHMKEWDEHYNAFKTALLKHGVEGKAMQYLDSLDRSIQAWRDCEHHKESQP